MKYVMSPLIRQNGPVAPITTLTLLNSTSVYGLPKVCEEINNPLDSLDIKRLDQNYLGEYTTDYMTET